MARAIEEPSRDGNGVERHPAFALIGASRVQSSTPGAVLFDSDVRHHHYVVVSLRRATRKRDLNRDWLHPDTSGMPLVEVAMSEAQWASFVSSMNVGNGVPCTLQATEGEPTLPGLPYAPRLQKSMDEVRAAGEKALAEVRAAFETYKEHKTAANLRTLEARIVNAVPNMAYTAESLNEHAEDVVQRARADIEAMVLAKADQLGLAPGDLEITPRLTTGDEGP